MPWSFSPASRDREKSSLAFRTLYTEAQRSYLDSVAPYARRLFEQTFNNSAGSPTTRSSVGRVTTVSNLLRMLYSRAGTYSVSFRWACVTLRNLA